MNRTEPTTAPMLRFGRYHDTLVFLDRRVAVLESHVPTDPEEVTRWLQFVTRITSGFQDVGFIVSGGQFEKYVKDVGDLLFGRRDACPKLQLILQMLDGPSHQLLDRVLKTPVAVVVAGIALPRVLWVMCGLYSRFLAQRALLPSLAKASCVSQLIRAVCRFKGNPEVNTREVWFFLVAAVGVLTPYTAPETMVTGMELEVVLGVVDKLHFTQEAPLNIRKLLFAALRHVALQPVPSPTRRKAIEGSALGFARHIHILLKQRRMRSARHLLSHFSVITERLSRCKGSKPDTEDVDVNGDGWCQTLLTDVFPGVLRSKNVSLACVAQVVWAAYVTVTTVNHRGRKSSSCSAHCRVWFNATVAAYEAKLRRFMRDPKPDAVRLARFLLSALEVTAGADPSPDFGKVVPLLQCAGDVCAGDPYMAIKTVTVLGRLCQGVGDASQLEVIRNAMVEATKAPWFSMPVSCMDSTVGAIIDALKALRNAGVSQGVELPVLAGTIVDDHHATDTSLLNRLHDAVDFQTLPSFLKSRLCFARALALEDSSMDRIFKQ